jgi:hypothetical protein
LTSFSNRNHLDKVQERGPHELKRSDCLRFEIRLKVMFNMLAGTGAFIRHVMKHNESVCGRIPQALFGVQETTCGNILSELGQRN